MKSVLSVLSALFLMACSGCVSTAHPKDAYASEEAFLMSETSVRILVKCSSGGGFVGSGTTVAQDEVLTARHVVRACEEEGEGEAINITVTTLDGQDHTMVVDSVSPTRDAATLISLLEEAPFSVIAPVGDEMPRIGDTVSWTGGDGHYDLNGLIKSAVVSALTFPDDFPGLIICGGKASHGNSGAGVWFHGKLVGVLVIGASDPDYDFVMGYEPIGGLKDILPAPAWKSEATN